MHSYLHLSITYNSTLFSSDYKLFNYADFVNFVGKRKQFNVVFRVIEYSTRNENCSKKIKCFSYITHSNVLNTYKGSLNNHIS